jgi:uncharacterized membrane protein YfcA
MDLLPDYSITNWMLLSLAGFCIGMSKAGLKGVDMLNITIMAIVLGSKSSTGVVLPLLCIADFLAVLYYRRHVNWSHFRKLAPWITAGILIGVLLGQDMNELYFKKVMAVIIVIAVAIMIFLEVRKSLVLPSNKLFAATSGLVAGITTMLGNLGGSFANIYFLAMRVPKNGFIGTAAWLFFCVNLFKLPFQFFAWHNINASTLSTDLVLIPALLLGFWAGIKIVAMIHDDGYRKIVIAMTLIGAIFIFLR